MGLFSFFGAAGDEVEGSYCEPKGRHIDVLKEDEIDDAIESAKSRGDKVEYSEKEFDNTCVSTRHDEDGKDAVSGPALPWWRR